MVTTPDKIFKPKLSKDELISLIESYIAANNFIVADGGIILRLREEREVETGTIQAVAAEYHAAGWEIFDLMPPYMLGNDSNMYVLRLFADIRKFYSYIRR